MHLRWWSHYPRGHNPAVSCLLLWATDTAWQVHTTIGLTIALVHTCTCTHAHTRMHTRTHAHTHTHTHTHTGTPSLMRLMPTIPCTALE